jgi:hypothetical protein
MKSKLLLMTVLASIVLAAHPSFAQDRAVTYAASDGFTCCGAVDSPAGPIEVPVGFGGYEFRAGGDPTGIKVEDLGGPTVGILVCQEGPSQTGETPQACGLGDDVEQTLCSTGNMQNLSTLFKPGVPVLVFVMIIDIVGSCQGTGTAGTLTLRTT